MANYGHPESGWIVYMPDLTSCAQFGSVLPKKAQKGAGVQEWSGPVLAECNPSATSFPLLYLIAFFHNWPRSYCAKPSWVQFEFGWLRLIWAKQIWSGSKTVCIIGPTSGPRWIGSSMFTGSKAECQQSALWLAYQCWDHLNDTSCHGHQQPCAAQCEWHGSGLFASDTTGSFFTEHFQDGVKSTSSCTCSKAHLHKAPLHILVDRLADKSSRSILREHFQDGVKLNIFMHLFWSTSPQSALTHFGWQTGR